MSQYHNGAVSGRGRSGERDLGVLRPETSSEYLRFGEHNQNLIHVKTGMKLVWIPPGSLQVPVRDSEGRRLNDSLKTLTIPNGFFIGECPVTNAQYEDFVKASSNSYFRHPYKNYAALNGPSVPVVGLMKDEAEDFCEWIGGRLPTEEEWEYACRANCTDDFYFGGDISDDMSGRMKQQETLKIYAWCKENCRSTMDVGTKPPNDFGLRDMIGNVWEWCSDNILMPRKQVAYPIRGGSWQSQPHMLTSYARMQMSLSQAYETTGFRVVIDSNVPFLPDRASALLIGSRGP